MIISTIYFVPKDKIKKIDIIISICSPVQIENTDWQCGVKISYNGEITERCGVGANALDALVACLFIITVDLNHYAIAHKGHFETKYGTKPFIMKYLQVNRTNEKHEN